MPTPSVVLAAIDAAHRLREQDPILFARMSRAGRNAGELLSAYVALEHGATVPFVAHLDAPATRRSARRRRREARAARHARRANR